MGETHQSDVVKWRFGEVAGAARLGATFTPRGRVERDAGDMLPALIGKQFGNLRASAPKPRPRPKKKVN